jgi:hypothetical protein
MGLFFSKMMSFFGEKEVCAHSPPPQPPLTALCRKGFSRHLCPGGGEWAQRYVVRVNARRTQRVEVIPLFHPRSRATAKPTSPDPDPAPAQRSELPD